MILQLIPCDSAAPYDRKIPYVRYIVSKPFPSSLFLLHDYEVKEEIYCFVIPADRKVVGYRDKVAKFKPCRAFRWGDL
jgi:hypothetical protein